MAVSFKGAHFPKDIMLMGVRWYVAYPLRTRHVEAFMQERGVEVDHSTINRWGIKYSLQREEAFHHRQRPVWGIWRMDETSVKVKGQWYSLYRVVDKHGQTRDFWLTEHRDKEAALRFRGVFAQPPIMSCWAWAGLGKHSQLFPPLMLFSRLPMPAVSPHACPQLNGRPPPVLRAAHAAGRRRPAGPTPPSWRRRPGRGRG
jgi:hypothetical protein